MSMRRYEVVSVLAPHLTEEEVKTLIETFSNAAVDKGAKVLQVDEWGKRRLAFPVKKHKDAFFVVLTLEEEKSAAVTELERRFRVSDAVIRFLTVRIDEDLKRAAKFEDRRKARKAPRMESPAEAQADPGEDAESASTASREEREENAAMSDDGAPSEGAEAAALENTPNDAETVEES